MTLEEFKSLCEIYGADLSRWPEAYHQQAAELSTESSQLRHILNEAAMLDALLASHEVAGADHILFERIVASAQKPTSLWQQLTSLMDIRFAGLGLASAMAGAFCFSMWLGSMHMPSDNAESVGSITEYVDFGNDWI
ncbi:MAG TPA: hypothetical protein VK974_05185 [Methylophilaceae bacterium]|nr:hypothetical protein [Methylophilaceae bacterium]